MKAKLFILFFFCLNLTFSQDTTWVQTFTFDSITTRRANFEFPSELNNKRFEKVLMYYKLKCSPLTTWDQFDCGEWDYLTYTRVYNHTGLLDSTQVIGKKYLANTLSPDTISITSSGSNYYDYYYDFCEKNLEMTRNNRDRSRYPMFRGISSHGHHS